MAATGRGIAALLALAGIALAGLFLSPQAALAAAPTHADYPQNCVYCHSSHSSPQDKLLLVQALDELHATDAGDADCVSCHPGTLAETHQEASRETTEGPVTSCRTCHDGNGPPETGTSRACVTCHADKRDAGGGVVTHDGTQALAPASEPTPSVDASLPPPGDADPVSTEPTPSAEPTLTAETAPSVEPTMPAVVAIEPSPLAGSEPTPSVDASSSTEATPSVEPTAPTAPPPAEPASPPAMPEEAEPGPVAEEPRPEPAPEPAVREPAPAASPEPVPQGTLLAVSLDTTVGTAPGAARDALTLLVPEGSLLTTAAGDAVTLVAARATVREDGTVLVEAWTPEGLDAGDAEDATASLAALLAGELDPWVPEALDARRTEAPAWDGYR